VFLVRQQGEPRQPDNTGRLCRVPFASSSVPAHGSYD
jgi:hypothetical protein